MRTNRQKHKAKAKVQEARSTRRAERAAANETLLVRIDRLERLVTRAIQLAAYAQDVPSLEEEAKGWELEARDALVNK